MLTIELMAAHMKLHDDRFDELSNQFNLVTAELRKIKVAMRSTSTPGLSTGTSLNVYRCKSSFPIDTYADLLLFENTMEQERQDIVVFLTSIGGSSPERMMANLVSAVYSLELKVATTWKGKKGSTGWTKGPLECTKLPYLFIGKFGIC